MGVKNSLSSNGSTSVIGVKLSPEMNQKIEYLSGIETKYNKSEMIRILLQEALNERAKQEEIINEMAKLEE